MKFPIKDILSKCDQIRSFLRIWSYLFKKSLMENFIFCTVLASKFKNISYFIWGHFKENLKPIPGTFEDIIQNIYRNLPQ